jgi:hypothetical protein
MKERGPAEIRRDRELVQAMRRAGEPMEAVEELLACLELSADAREDLLTVARAAGGDIANGDTIGMNPLTSQPQRASPR